MCFPYGLRSRPHSHHCECVSLSAIFIDIRRLARCRDSKQSKRLEWIDRGTCRCRDPSLQAPLRLDRPHRAACDRETMFRTTGMTEALYPHLPIPLQNVACSWYGRKEAKIRLGREFEGHLARLLE